MKKKETKCIRIATNTKQIKNCKDDLATANSSIHFLSKAFNLAGNEVRLKILFLLYKKQRLCVCDLADILDMSIPAISQHLRKMKDGKIVYNEREGQTIYYSIKSSFLELFEPFFEKISINSLQYEL